MTMLWKQLKTSRLRSVALTVLTLCGVGAFTLGVGAASLKETIEYQIAGSLPASQVKSVVIQPLGASSNPTTLKVEILRGDHVVCTGESKPVPNSTGYTTDYSMTKEMSSCPSFREGDVVKATLSQTNEINLSYDAKR